MPLPIKPDEQIKDFIKIRAEQLGLTRTPTLTLEWVNQCGKVALSANLKLYVPALSETLYIQTYHDEEEFRASIPFDALGRSPYWESWDLRMAEPLGAHLEYMLCELCKAILRAVIEPPKKADLNPILKPL